MFCCRLKFQYCLYTLATDFGQAVKIGIIFFLVKIRDLITNKVRDLFSNKKKKNVWNEPITGFRVLQSTAWLLLVGSAITTRGLLTRWSRNTICWGWKVIVLFTNQLTVVLNPLILTAQLPLREIIRPFRRRTGVIWPPMRLYRGHDVCNKRTFLIIVPPDLLSKFVICSFACKICYREPSVEISIMAIFQKKI